MNMLTKSDIEELRYQIKVLLEQANESNVILKRVATDRRNYLKRNQLLLGQTNKLYRKINKLSEENNTLRKNVADLTKQHYASLKRIKDLVDANAPKIEKEHKTK